MSELLSELKIGAVPHGFRSSLRDWAAEEADHPREVIEAALAHVVQTGSRRRLSAYGPVRAGSLMDDWASYLNGRASAGHPASLVGPSDPSRRVQL